MLNDDLDGTDEQAADQSVKKATQQAGKKPSATLADEFPELVEKASHALLFFGEPPQKANVLLNHDRMNEQIGLTRISLQIISTITFQGIPII